MNLSRTSQWHLQWCHSVPICRSGLSGSHFLISFKYRFIIVPHPYHHHFSSHLFSLFRFILSLRFSLSHTLYPALLIICESESLWKLITGFLVIIFFSQTRCRQSEFSLNKVLLPPSSSLRFPLKSFRNVIFPLHSSPIIRLLFFVNFGFLSFSWISKSSQSSKLSIFLVSSFTHSLSFCVSCSMFPISLRGWNIWKLYCRLKINNSWKHFSKKISGHH